MNKYNSNMLILLWLTTVLVFVTVVYNIKIDNLHHQYITLHDCANSRNSGNYRKCYVDEYKFNTEYVCNNTAMDCWVEVH